MKVLWDWFLVSIDLWEVQTSMIPTIQYYHICLCVFYTVVRLVEGKTYIQGRVEVYFNGTWSTIYPTRWDDVDASVVCRQLQLGTFGFVWNTRYNGRLHQWFNYVSCNGNESSLFHCDHQNIGYEQCHRYYCYAAGVTCGMSFYVYTHGTLRCRDPSIMPIGFGKN